MDDSLRLFVRERAEYRCEYCRFPEEYSTYLPFHIEHIIAKQHGGSDLASNLALACHPCNLHKGPNLTGIDPVTKKLVKLFHPRRHKWLYHFQWDGPILIGRTRIGRATIAVLQINAPEAIKDREALIEEGVFP